MISLKAKKGSIKNIFGNNLVKVKEHEGVKLKGIISRTYIYIIIHTVNIFDLHLHLTSIVL